MNISNWFSGSFDFIMQSLKLHVLKLTKNIDDLKLQLVSVLGCLFSSFLFFLHAIIMHNLPNQARDGTKKSVSMDGSNNMVMLLFF